MRRGIGLLAALLLLIGCVGCKAEEVMVLQATVIENEANLFENGDGFLLIESSLGQIAIRETGFPVYTAANEQLEFSDLQPGQPIQVYYTGGMTLTSPMGLEGVVKIELAE